MSNIDKLEIKIAQIYFIKQVKSNYFKIGYTTGLVSSRVSGLQVGNPLLLKPKFVIKFYYSTIKDILKVEKYVHTYFKEEHWVGEWFDIKDLDLIRLNLLCNELNLILDISVSLFNYTEHLDNLIKLENKEIEKIELEHRSKRLLELRVKKEKDSILQQQKYLSPQKYKNKIEFYKNKYSSYSKYKNYIKDLEDSIDLINTK